ncbi:MAG: type III pantothenate kinase [Firmicutes bacterium]|nr:type III pantothenate kinase [Bacillota bacterium]
MIFAIDVGNTHLVTGCLDEKGAHYMGRFETDVKATAEEYAIKFKTWLDINEVDPKTLEGGIISTVVPPLISTLTRAVYYLTGKTPLVIGPGVRTGLNIKIDNPAQLGADMVTGAVASLAKYPTPQVVFDLGTATTASVIDKSGAFRGVVILPGVRTGLAALSNNTSQLPHIDLTAPKHVIGTNTIDSMRSGSVFGTAAMMDGIAQRVEEELGEEATLIATGGLASSIIPHCKRQFILDESLLLDGLWLIYKKNQG